MVNNLQPTLKLRPIVNEYCFILIPFFIFIAVKCYHGSSADILESTDWSMVSFIILAQRFGLVSAEILNLKNKNLTYDGDGYLSYFLLSIVGILICLGTYIAIMSGTAPPFFYKLQLFIFAYASLRFFIDSRKLQILKTLGS